MSLTGPKAANPTLTIEFNTRVSAAAYDRARDGVLLVKGAKFLSEDEAKRTMKVEATNGSVKGLIEQIPGVEQVTEQRAPANWRNHRL
jgi:hypothetical protein